MFRSAFTALNATRVVASRKFSTNQGKSFQRGATAACTAAAAAGIAAAAFAANSTPFAACDADYGALRKEIVSMLDAEEERREDGTSMAGTLIRLAWHCSGTYSAADKTGGSNGATQRFDPEASWGANAGLGGARAFLAPLKEKYNMSYADLFTFGGVVAVESMGGPKIPWRSGKNKSRISFINDAYNFFSIPIFNFSLFRILSNTKGRTDSAVKTTVPDGRLPDADKGCPVGTTAHLRDIFYRMGFNDREIVALSGAHAIGRCHTDASGYWGPWSNAETTFSNEYFRLLLEEQWTIKRTHEGKPWKGPAQFESPDGKLMMLPSDIALIQDPEFRKYVELYKKDEALFFKDFSAAFSKLMELGVPFPWNSTRV